MSRSPWFTAVLLLTLTSCGEDDPDSPLLGLWQVDTRTHNDVGCVGEGPADTGPSHLRFIVTDILGQKVIEELECASATMCDESGGLFGKFYGKEIAGGLRFEAFISIGDDANCSYAATTADAVVSADDKLRIETRSFQSAPMMNVDCDPDVAEEMLAQLPCKTFDVITGTRVSR